MCQSFFVAPICIDHVTEDMLPRLYVVQYLRIRYCTTGTAEKSRNVSPEGPLLHGEWIVSKCEWFYITTICDLPHDRTGKKSWSTLRKEKSRNSESVSKVTKKKYNKHSRLRTMVKYNKIFARNGSKKKALHCPAKDFKSTS